MAPVGQLGVTYQFIRNLLATSEMVPGTKLSRRRLAEQIGVSPALVQQALGQLEREGLVERRPQSGTYVREMDQREYANLCDVRELIEPYAADRAATRLTAAQLNRLERSCARFSRWSQKYIAVKGQAQERTVLRKLVVEEQVFHGIILKASGNPLLHDLISNLRLLSRAQPRREDNMAGRQVRIAAEHEGIFHALADRDADLARERMRLHIQGSRVLLSPDAASEQAVVPQRS